MFNLLLQLHCTKKHLTRHGCVAWHGDAFFTKCLVLVHFSPLSEPSVRDEEAAGPSLSHAAEQGGALSGEEGTPP